jgi:hypothetical protein
LLTTSSPIPGYGLVCPVLSSRARACRRKPPSAQSPFARCRRYLHQEAVYRLLRGHYSSFFAPTDSFANPMWLSLPSASGLVQGVLAGCYQPLLPMGSSRRYLCESFLGCLVPYPGGSHRVPIPVSSSVSSAFPIKRLGRLPAWFCEHDFSQRDCRGCRHSIMFRPPSLLASQIVPTAMPIAQGSRGFYVRAERASLPPHAPNMLAA